MSRCNRETEVYSRVCGYHRPVKSWNRGKQEEFLDRLEYRPAFEVAEIRGGRA